MEIRMRFDTDAIIGERGVVISLRGDPIVVDSLKNLISEFMKKQTDPTWVAR